MSKTVRGYPSLSKRSQQWLHYLHRKATTLDNWDKGGQPSEMRDGKSDPPMLSWHRFDLIDSSYAMALMADITPAWREIYSEVLDKIL